MNEIELFYPLEKEKLMSSSVGLGTKAY